MITAHQNQSLFTSKILISDFFICKMDFFLACLKKNQGMSIFKGHRLVHEKCFLGALAAKIEI